MNTNNRLHKTVFNFALAICVTALANSPVLAQNFQDKPIKLIVGFSAGGLTDALPRLLAGALSERLGQPVIVENKTGAAGNIATSFVAASAPDGHTLLASTVGQIVVSPHTTKMNINPATDLIHISMMGEGDQFFNINPEVPAQNYAEFAELIKKNPGKYFYGDAGAGGSMNLYIEYFKLLTKLDLKGIHYRGASSLMPDLLSNRVQMSLNTYPVIQGYVAEDKLRPILLIGKERDSRLPSVPTVAEMGLKELEAASNWFGLHAPKGTHPEIIRKIQDAVIDSLKTDAVKKGLEALALRAVGNTSKEFTDRIMLDYDTFGDVARTAKITSE